MICPNCGANVSTGAAFCQYCGTNLAAAANKAVIPNNNAVNDSLFRMTIEDIFSITGRGTIITGTIDSGTIKVNDNVMITGQNKEPKSAVVSGIDMFRKTLTTATKGETVGLVLKGVTKEAISIGQVVQGH